MSLLDLLNLDLSECHKTNKSKIIAEYIWIDGSGMNLRSKGRELGVWSGRDQGYRGWGEDETLHGPVTNPSQIPKWNYDGSSTGQAPGEDSEVILYPQAIYKDPFRGGNHILVMCDAYTPAGEPIPTNKRFNAVKIFSHPEVLTEEPWFGIEQEYTLLQKNLNWPLGWPIGGYRGPQGPYYCGVGAEKAFGRDIVDSHYKACLYTGVNIGGINAEVMAGQGGYYREASNGEELDEGKLACPAQRAGYLDSTSIKPAMLFGSSHQFDQLKSPSKQAHSTFVLIQWEFQVGPTVGISPCDDLWVARYILVRIAEAAGVIVSFDPKPVEGDCNGTGAHTNYSTKSMRADGGLEVINKAIEKLGKRHKEHIAAYGVGNERRLTGEHETADINTFNFGIADRRASIRIGRDTQKAGKGYLEDRRPSSNMDPYVVTSMIAETTILWKP
ncbi:hypothetical protein MTR67_051157 [Solanum verrucosum]|uniref:Glutamine synthetase n=1 Tax=Solanum verrucosum TaxID=315347 RepID=A0AAF0V3S8_SOLVR|nr:hypothetical protein MTR67_051157 [Solanum verrucosum]